MQGQETLPSSVGQGVRIVDDYAVVFIQGDVASFAVVAQGLVDPHPGGAHKPCQVCLGEAQGDEGAA